ncbi:MAG: RbsD/FucU family protein [Hasllibacter sp.]
MLKGIDPLLGPDLLHALRGMGHGDVLALVDANYPAEAQAALTPHGAVIRLDGHGLGRAAGAILSVMPLDDFTDDFALRMAPDDAPDTLSPPQEELAAALRAAGEGREMRPIARPDFYEAAARAHAIVQTGERRLYGCALLRKGVLRPDG